MPKDSDDLSEQKVNAYLDGANLHRGVLGLGWILDYSRFRIWLSEKHRVSHAYLFIGFVSKYKDLYTTLQEAGYTLVFKETTRGENGRVKGNCDADLVLHAVCHYYEHAFARAVLVSSDGDYAGLVKFLHEREALETIVSPSNKCSILLKRLNVPLTYIRDIHALVAVQNEKAPDADGTA
jgi:uncharacterized LabA/DUF88 family protein